VDQQRPEITQDDHQNAAGRRQSQRTDDHQSQQGQGLIASSGQSDFLSNILRWIAEERLNLAVERPAAICHITGLPTAAPTTVTEAPKAPKK
jgi:hypothetical protein